MVLLTSVAAAMPGRIDRQREEYVPGMKHTHIRITHTHVSKQRITLQPKEVYSTLLFHPGNYI